MSNVIIYASDDKQELDEAATVNYELTVQKEGEREVSRNISFYNLDPVEKDYLKTIQTLASQAKKESRKK